MWGIGFTFLCRVLGCGWKLLGGNGLYCEGDSGHVCLQGVGLWMAGVLESSRNCSVGIRFMFVCGWKLPRGE